MREVDESGTVAEVVATRTISGGIAGLNTTLTIRSDGSLHLSDRRFGKDEMRELEQKRVRPLQDALSKPEWQEVEPFYGQPVPDSFTTTIEGGGKRTGMASPSAEPVTIPPILSEVLGYLDDLWAMADHSPIDDLAEAQGSPEPNLFQLEGEDVQISYGVLRARREFLDYKDMQRDVSFSGEEGEIESLESRIGKFLTVKLNRDEAIADADLITLTLLLPRISLRGQGTPFETLAIRTTHLSGFRPHPAEGPQQLYEALSLKGTAGQAD